MVHATVPDLSARQLRAVLAIAEYRSFIAAAVFLKISQPALTRTIQQVESMLGVSLFSRTTRQVSLTPAGREFAALAQRMLNDMQISLASLRQHTQQQVGQIIVSSVLSLADAVWPELLVDFGRRYPGIQVQLREGIQLDVLDDLRSGLADFAIGYVEGIADNLLVEGMRQERFYVVMPATHPLAARRRLTMHDVATEAFVSFARESRSRQVADGAAHALGLTLRYAMTVNRLATLLALVRNGVGLAIVTGGECPADDRRFAVRPLTGNRFTCRLAVLRSRERQLTPAAAIFLVVVQRWLRGQAAPPGRRAARAASRR